MPVIWFEVTADLSDKLLGLVHFTLIGPYIGSACFFLMFCVNLGIVAYIGIKIIKKNNKLKSQETAVTTVETGGKDEPTKELQRCFDDVIPEEETQSVIPDELIVGGGRTDVPAEQQPEINSE